MPFTLTSDLSFIVFPQFVSINENFPCVCKLTNCYYAWMYWIWFSLHDLIAKLYCLTKCNDSNIHASDCWSTSLLSFSFESCWLLFFSGCETVTLFQWKKNAKGHAHIHAQQIHKHNNLHMKSKNDANQSLQFILKKQMWIPP